MYEVLQKMYEVLLIWMLAEIYEKYPLCQDLDVCHLGSYALAVHMVAFLEEL